MLRPASLAIAGLFLACPPAWSQEATTAAPRFLILDTSKADTLQRELDQAAAAGYRPVDGNTAYNLLVLEKTGEPPSGRAYRVLWFLNKQLQQAAADGFRVIPQTLGTKDFSAAVVQKGADSDPRYEYLIVDAGRRATFGREIAQAAGQGFSVVGMVSGEHEHVAVLERRAGSAPGTSNATSQGERFKLLAANKSSTLQSELSDHASRGYRVLFASAAKETIVLLEMAEAGQRREYVLLTTTKSSTLQQEMNDAASRGFRLLAGTMTAIQKRLGLMGTYGYEVGAVMEKSSDSDRPHEYLVIGARRTSTLGRELNDAAARGYAVVRAMVAYQETLIVLERLRQETPSSPEVDDHRTEPTRRQWRRMQ